MNVIRATCGLGALALVLSLGNAASAQWGFGGYGYGGGFGYGYGGTYSMNPPPYFAMFPPVYYSYPVSRSYGVYPFAYAPGGCAPSEVVVATGGNRRYARQSYATQTVRAGRPAPVIIENPFVLPPDKRPTRLADGRPLPQVIDMREVATAKAAPQAALAKAADRD